MVREFAISTNIPILKRVEDAPVCVWDVITKTYMSPLGTVEQMERPLQLGGLGRVDFTAAGVLVRPWYLGGLAEGRAPVGVPHEVEECGGRCQDDIPK